jgi:hypothetical protein
VLHRTIFAGDASVRKSNGLVFGPDAGGATRHCIFVVINNAVLRRSKPAPPPCFGRAARK